jgi:hypothetical protein
MIIPAIMISLGWLQPTQGRAQIENWSHFRGSELNGISLTANPPVSWNDTLHVFWKTNLEGKGWSSPIVYGDQIWLTTAAAEGASMSAVCVDLSSGKILQEKVLFTPEDIESKHAINTYATPAILRSTLLIRTDKALYCIRQ